MLYKKYHRNFVRKLKKGTKIEIYSNDIYTTDRFINSEVKKEPFVDYCFGVSIVVVYHSGKTSYKIEIKENAIQEISQKLC